MRVAFLGPAGTFTEEALQVSSPADSAGGIEELPYPTVYETVMAVHNREVDRAVVPIENSLEGSVNATLDTLAGEAADVRIAREVILPIHHCLIARDGTRMEDVRRLISHPQALAQCERFVRAQLPDVERGSVGSTAEAVQLVAESGEPWAAIGSRISAELYRCRLLAEAIEDRAGNETRFVWLAPRDAPADGPESKTSVVFWGFNDESPGALVGVLSEFADRDINLTKIESRPRRVQLGHYMFFADLEGGASDPPVADALEALRSRVAELRVLGSYPAA
ncbi:MAG: prephenate dehydratase [Thermoleophilaceae bacterium]